MSKLLDIDKKLVEEFNIKDELTNKEKIAYLDEQADGIKHMMWRLRVDTMLNSAITPETEEQEVEASNKLRTYRNDIKQMAKGLEALAQLKSEL